MIKVGIIGATGYAGVEIVRLIMQHKEAEVVWFGSRSYVDQDYASVFRNMFQIVDAKCLEDNMEELAEAVDVIFTATPQGLCGSLVNEEILNKVKIIDLSADFRIKDVATYEKWYGIKHQSPQFIEEAVYGLCEINRDKVKGARIIANPGCYTTCSILSIYPMVKEGLIDPKSIIVDAKSGTSGAGRGAKVPNLFCEVNENIKAYGVTTHRHTPEIEEQLSYAAGEEVMINFTPHLVPMQRGILVTAYHLFELISHPPQLNGSTNTEHNPTGTGKHMERQRTLRLNPLMTDQGYSALSTTAEHVCQSDGFVTIKCQSQKIADYMFVHVIIPFLTIIGLIRLLRINSPICIPTISYSHTQISCPCQRNNWIILNLNNSIGHILGSQNFPEAVYIFTRQQYPVQHIF